MYFQGKQLCHFHFRPPLLPPGLWQYFDVFFENSQAKSASAQTDLPLLCRINCISIFCAFEKTGEEWWDCTHVPINLSFLCFRVATYHSLQNSLTFPWFFPDILVYHTLWKIKKKYSLLLVLTISLLIWGLLLKERICSPREQILSYKSSPQWGGRWA